MGITGRDLLLDSDTAATEIEALGFGASTFRFAAPAALDSLEKLEGKRIATSYPVLVRSFLASHGVTPIIVTLDGAVESAVKLGVADAVADVVSTGATLHTRNARPLPRTVVLVFWRVFEFSFILYSIFLFHSYFQLLYYFLFNNC